MLAASALVQHAPLTGKPPCICPCSFPGISTMVEKSVTFNTRSNIVLFNWSHMSRTTLLFGSQEIPPAFDCNRRLGTPVKVQQLQAHRAHGITPFRSFQESHQVWRYIYRSTFLEFFVPFPAIVAFEFELQLVALFVRCWASVVAVVHRTALRVGRYWCKNEIN